MQLVYRKVTKFFVPKNRLSPVDGKDEVLFLGLTHTRPQ